MADPQVLTTLRRKQAEIENAIAAYEKRAEEARRDLSAINAVIRLFSVETDAGSVSGYMDSRRRSRTYRLVRSHFRAGEIGKERRHVAMLPLDDAGKFRAKLKRQPEAADPHILDAVARHPPDDVGSAIERCLDEIAFAAFDRQA